MLRIAAFVALAIAGALLALQILAACEYTEGGSLYTRFSMIAAMVTLAALPVFIEAARIARAPGIALALFVAFLAFLAYSLPATTGRTGEIKEVKAAAAQDVALVRAELASITQTLGWARPDQLSECAGAPVPLPPQGWPRCRQKTGTVKALEERQAKLESELRSSQSHATGDLGSDLWAWVLSPLGITAATVRKLSVLCFAVGLDVVIWALIWFSTTVFTSVSRVSKVSRTVSRLDYTGVPDVTDKELEELKRLLRSARRPLTNTEIAERCGVVKGEASKRVSKAVEAGLVSRRRVGKEVAVTLN